MGRFDYLIIIQHGSDTIKSPPILRSHKLGLGGYLTRIFRCWSSRVKLSLNLTPPVTYNSFRRVICYRIFYSGVKTYNPVLSIDHVFENTNRI